MALDFCLNGMEIEIVSLREKYIYINLFYIKIMDFSEKKKS